MTLSASETMMVISVAGECYQNRSSGELVSAAAVHSELLAIGLVAIPGDMLVADEYGGIFVVSAGQFWETYIPSSVCLR